MIFPYKFEVNLKGSAFGNYLIASLLIGVFVIEVIAHVENWNPFILKGSFGYALFTYFWLHRDIFHLGMNLIFLLVFGNPLCRTIGSIKYVLLFLLFGVLAGVGHVLLSEKTVIGASGAIFAVLGVILVQYPFCKVRFWILFERVKIASFWAIAWWVFTNLLAYAIGFTEITNVAYSVHIGGFIMGLATGVFLKALGILKSYDDSICFKIE